MRSVFPVLLAVSLIVAAGFLLVPIDMKAASARGRVDMEISWPKEAWDDEPGFRIVQEVSWQGQVGHLRLPAAFELKLEKEAGDNLALEKGQLNLRPGDAELRMFHNVGFRSTLDPIRLLSSSRRAEGAKGIELSGRFGSWSGRGLWVSEIENTGDNGPLFLLDMSLPPMGSSGKYRYIYLSHDSGWQWRYPKSGPYATRTARSVHSLMGTWTLGSSLRLSSQAAVLQGFDVTRTYRRDLQGLAVISRMEGPLGTLNWGMDIYRTNPGFLLATGDSDSLDPGMSGLGIRLAKSRRDQSLRLSLRYEQPVPEARDLEHAAEAAVKGADPRSEAELTYRRRLDFLTYRLGFGWERESNRDTFQITWDTNWPSRRLQVGGRLGGENPAQIQSRMELHPMVTADFRWQPVEACWRSRFKIDGAKSPWQKLTPWEGEIIYKKRPGETYTYLAVRHKMEQGYWEAAWGKSDQGRIDWYWQEEPRISIKVGRYF
ncbi:MAG: hypothetical protein GX047_10520 [Firmicutes bacterium]|nr:hypothetical protein [Bacillota bacterium]